MIAIMKTTATFTSTIAPEIIAWVDKTARAKKKTRRTILEEAVMRYKRELTRQSLTEGFKRAANDPEMFELAQMGVDDYVRMVDSL